MQCLRFSLQIQRFSSRPWDSHNDISTYEKNFMICTRTRHHTHPTLSHKPSLLHPSLIPEKTEEISTILQRIESLLNRTNQRLSVYEKEIHPKHSSQWNFFFSSHVQIVFLVLIFAFLFQFVLFSKSK